MCLEANNSYPIQDVGDEDEFVNDNYGSDLYDIVIEGELINSPVIVSLPYFDDFEDNSYSDIWTMGTGNNNWIVGTDEAYNSTNSAYISDDGTNAHWSTGIDEDVDLELKLDLRGFSRVDLSFMYKCAGDDYNGVSYGQDICK